MISLQGSTCMSGFMASPASNALNGPSWIIGDVFIRTRVVIFDMDKQQIGLASKKNN